MSISEAKRSHKNKLQIVAIFGPTAVGKTALALALAQHLSGVGESPVAISADAIQVYLGLDTLTGKASIAQQRELEHRLISYVPVAKPYNAYLYAREAHREIDSLLAEKRRPIVVGGTGLYLRAAIAEMSMKPTPAGKSSDLWSTATRHPTVIIGLVMAREQLYQRIEDRVDQMVAGNVRLEVERAVSANAARTARKAIGFEQLAAGLADEEVSAAMKVLTRQYAKRQMTWLRKIPNIHKIDVTERSPAEVSTEIVALLDD